MSDKVDFIDTHIVAAGDVAGILAAGGLQAMDGFQSIWAYGQTTSTGTPALSTLAQTYIIPDLPAVEVFLATTGIRGHNMMDTIIATGA